MDYKINSVDLSSTEKLIRRSLWAKQARNYRKNLRLKFIKEYGSKCVCCGINNSVFLTLEHINRDGKSHRDAVGGTAEGVYRDVIKRNFPNDFELLCYNCNIGRWKVGLCPHEKNRMRLATKRIGLDVDGVCALFTQGVLDRAEEMGLGEYFPKTHGEITRYGISDKFDEVMDKVWEDEKFWLNLKPVAGSLPVPFTPYVYITSRRISGEITTKWLNDNGFPFAPVISVSHPREKVSIIKDLQLDLFVDDLHLTVREIRNAGFNGVLFRAPYQNAECKDLPTIDSLEEVCKWL